MTKKPTKKPTETPDAAAKTEAGAEGEAHHANPTHNHGPAANRPGGFNANRFGGKRPGPQVPKMMHRGANRGR